MPSDTIASTNAPTQVEQLSDSEGRIWFSPSVTVRTFLAQGRTTFQPLILLTSDAEAEPWLTVTQAAQWVVDEEIKYDLDVEKGKSLISRECTAQRIHHQGSGRDRRIDPASLRKWILAFRREENNKADQ